MAKAAVTRSIRDDHQKNFLKIFNGLTGKHSRWEIWEDFVTLTAIEISNSTDKVNAPERTKMYQTIISKYSTKEREGMAEMLGEVIMGMEQNPDQDFLGSLPGVRVGQLARRAVLHSLRCVPLHGRDYVRPEAAPGHGGIHLGI
jgi:hypothetical protein